MNYGRMRPRRMAYSGTRVGNVAADFSTLALFNNSSYAELLIVRAWSVSTTAAAIFYLNVTQGNLGGTPVPITPFIPTEAPPPGIVTFLNPTVAPSIGWTQLVAANVSSNWPIDFPFAIVPVGWSWSAAVNTANLATTASVMWEAIMPDQLDELAWLQANAAIIANPQGAAN